MEFTSPQNNFTSDCHNRDRRAGEHSLNANVTQCYGMLRKSANLPFASAPGGSTFACAFACNDSTMADGPRHFQAPRGAGIGFVDFCN
jgi:hypothetical protein